MAETVKHTPGPWFVGDNGADGPKPRYWIVTNEETWTDRVCSVPEYSAEKALANARLIAAAPDLLEALESLLDAYSKPDERLCCDGRECGCRGSTVYQMAEHYARAAISRAEGRS